ncbi:MAG: hypothetical protein OZSIB_3911 [Candidatus Ozemobacter sibiricus]|uniref:Uncharacterized protein n=1 Tax=Candidatus Ozemobacter sibiricus TaxID=2268124 RepID=A0A367ZPI6_9BACT|nr:MAG: hypothetical protein OZSIB_3911 [Candidatus Ozemobacter sibiricus]
MGRSDRRFFHPIGEGRRFGRRRHPGLLPVNRADEQPEPRPPGEERSDSEPRPHRLPAPSTSLWWPNSTIPGSSRTIPPRAP